MQGMEELKLIYLESLSSQADALRKAASSLETGDPEAMDTIRRIAHSLRGSGATYGFPEITEAAAVLEEAEPSRVHDPLTKLVDLLESLSSVPSAESVRILVIEDDPVNAEFVRAALEMRSREIIVAGDGSEARKILSQGPVSLILLDLVLPDVDGRSLLAEFKDQPGTASIPVIAISSRDEQRLKAECYALGAEEFMVKPLDPVVLSASVSSKIVRTASSIRQSHRCPLTDLPNRAYFHEVFDRAAASSAREKKPLSVAIFDLDRFKSVNDTYGHAVGDEVLKMVAEVLRRTLRKSDFAARWGGEEFVVLFENTKPPLAISALDHVLEELGREEFHPEGHESFSVTFSGGVAEVAAGMSHEEAIAQADKFLYLAKQSGRNRILSQDDEVAPVTRKILVADDDDMIASLLVHRIGREGVDVVRVDNGAAAVEAAGNNDFSLVLLDVKMPEMDGFEVLVNIRKIRGYQHVPILMLTSMGSEKDILRGFELGADDYITKPFSPVELTARVLRHLKKGQ